MTCQMLSQTWNASYGSYYEKLNHQGQSFVTLLTPLGVEGDEIDRRSLGPF
jgi:hypothetical protein